MDRAQLVRRAAQGDASAFVELIRRFRLFAFASALTLLGDFTRPKPVSHEGAGPS